MLPLNTLGLTPTVTAHLNKMGIRTVFDLVLHLPLRYDDETRVVTIDHLTLGVSACVEAEVVSADIQYRPRRMLLVRVRDEIKMVFEAYAAGRLDEAKRSLKAV